MLQLDRLCGTELRKRQSAKKDNSESFSEENGQAWSPHSASLAHHNSFT